MIILGIDPGKTTGLALIEFDPETRKLVPLGIQESKDMEGIEWKDWVERADVVVVENFLVRPKKARQGAFDWDPMYAPRVVGSVKTLAKLYGKQLVSQEPAIKPVGYGFANQTYLPGKKGQHCQDAIAHAVFYAVKRLNALPVKGG